MTWTYPQYTHKVFATLFDEAPLHHYQFAFVAENQFFDGCEYTS